MIWLRCPERYNALKETAQCCCTCGVKKSQAKGRVVKMYVHHLHRPNWERILQVLKEELFSEPIYLWPLCVECHDDLHDDEDEGWNDFEFVQRKHLELFGIGEPLEDDGEEAVDALEQDSWDT
jgi:hypothetical protein